MNKTHTFIKRKLEYVVSRLRKGELNSHNVFKHTHKRDKLSTQKLLQQYALNSDFKKFLYNGIILQYVLVAATTITREDSLQRKICGRSIKKKK